MKKFYSFCLVCLMAFTGSILASSCSDDKDDGVESTITINDLPEAAVAFIKKYFSDSEISRIEEISEDDITVYQVNFTDGYEVVFNSSGEWQEVDAPYSMTVPSGIIPEQVLQTLNERYPGYGIVSINTTGEGWKVELNNDQGGASLNLWFNMSGEITNTGELD